MLAYLLYSSLVLPSICCYESQENCLANNKTIRKQYRHDTFICKHRCPISDTDRIGSTNTFRLFLLPIPCRNQQEYSRFAQAIVVFHHTEHTLAGQHGLLDDGEERDKDKRRIKDTSQPKASPENGYSCKYL